MNNELLEQLEYLINENDYLITSLANASSLLYHNLDDVNWCGFYLYHDNQLILGPFQGLPACTQIAINKGVCGSAYHLDQTLNIENVHLFDGHIACDSKSNSEIVVPIHLNGKKIGVLDIDSPKFNRFSLDDQAFIEAFALILERKIIHAK